MSAAAASASTVLVEMPALREVSSQLRNDDFLSQVREVLPENIRPEQFAGVIVTALREDVAKQSKPQFMLVNADRASLLQAAIRCAQDGLLPNGHEAALVVFAGKVQYMPMVGGLRKIAAEYGWTIRGQTVRENDEFEYTEEPPTLSFRHARPGIERGEPVYAYAVARHRDGRREQRVMTRDEVLKRRGVAKTQNVWNAWEDEMWAKTPEKDLFQELPLDPAEKKRFDILLAAANLDPAVAAISMYGPGGDNALTAPPATAGDEGQQAPGAASPAASSETPGAPGATTTPVAAPVAGGAGYNPGGDPIQEAARRAGMMVPPNGQHAAAGHTLDDILALGDEGRNWLRRWTGSPDLEPLFAAELLAFVRVHMPDVYAAVTDAAGIEF